MTEFVIGLLCVQSTWSVTNATNDGVSDWPWCPIMDSRAGPLSLHLSPQTKEKGKILLFVPSDPPIMKLPLSFVSFCLEKIGNNFLVRKLTRRVSTRLLSILEKKLQFLPHVFLNSIFAGRKTSNLQSDSNVWWDANRRRCHQSLTSPPSWQKLTQRHDTSRMYGFIKLLTDLMTKYEMWLCQFYYAINTWESSERFILSWESPPVQFGNLITGAKWHFSYPFCKDWSIILLFFPFSR
jgi:hypothetical protein